MKGPLRAAAVTLCARTSVANEGEVKATGSTDASGAFSVSAPGWTGPAYVKAAGGSYVDEATGATLTYGQHLSGMLAKVEPGKTYPGLRITPVTHVAVRRVVALGAFDEATVGRAQNEIAQLFGNSDPAGTAPASALQAAVVDGRSSDYGLLLAGISRWAQSLGVPPDQLVEALGADIADGTVDGRSNGAPLVVGSVDLSARPVSNELLNNTLLFAFSSRNAAGLVPGENLIWTLSRMDGALPDGAAPVADAGSDQDVDAGSLVRLAGSARGTNDTVSFRWRQVSGPPVQLSSDTSAAPTFTPAQDGVCVFELIVSAGGRDSRPARTRVGVRGPGARLMVRGVAVSPRLVSRGQAFTVEVGVMNVGRRAANVQSVSPLFRSAAGTDLSGDYTVVPATNPTAVAPGGVGNFIFTVTVKDVATLGDVVVDATALGVDASTGAATADPDADVTAKITVQSTSAVVIQSITAPSTVEMGKTASLALVLRNDGQARAQITGLTFSFKDPGGVDRSAQYTVTPAAGNPTVVQAGERVSWNATVAIARQATQGSITVNGTVAFRDLNSGVSGQNVGAEVPAVWTVVVPKVVFVDSVTGPVKVSRGQSTTVNVQLTNGTGFAATLDQVTLSFKQGANDMGSSYTVSPAASNPGTLQVGEVRTLAFTVGVVSGAATGATVVDASVRFTAGGATATEAGSAAPLTWTVQTPASLTLGAVSAPTLVSRGQTVTVAVPVSNAGEATAASLAVLPTFTGPSGQDVSGDFTVTASPSNPGTLNGGQAATLTFSVLVKTGATLQLAVVDATASATDGNSGVQVSDDRASASASWLVQLPGALMLPSVLSDRGTISQGQTFNVTLNVQNAGGATVNLVAATTRPSFTGAGGVSRASFYTVTPAVSNPALVVGGSTVGLRYTVAASASAPPEVVTVDGVANGIEANSGLPLTSGPAVTKASVTVQSVASLEILSVTAPTLVQRGQTVTVSMAVRNPGGAPANIGTSSLRFTQGTVNRNGDYVVTPTSVPSTIAPGVTATFQYSVAISASAAIGATVIDGSVSGTDANSGAAISDGAAATTATWNFATPGVLSITSINSQPRVSLGQTATVTMTVANTGGAPVNFTATNLTFRQGAADVSGQYTVNARAGNPTQVSPGTPVALAFDVTVSAGASTGAVTVDGNAAGTDAIFGGTVTDNAATAPLAWTVQTPAALTVSALVVPAFVSQGQTATVTVTAGNTGQATANLGTHSISFTGSAPRDSEYTVTPVAGNPTTIAGGASATLRFNVAVSATATREVVTLRATVNGSDANSGTGTNATGPASAPTWTVQQGPQLSVTALLCGPAVVSQGQTFSVTLTLANGGQATGRIDASALQFMLGAANRTGDYAVTPRAGNPTQVAGGTSVTLFYDATASGSAANGILDVTGRVTATDVNSGVQVAGTGPALPFALTVQRRATLDVVSVVGPATIAQGQTRDVTVSVQNTGEAAANGVSTTLTLRVAGIDRTSEYTRNLLSGPSSIAGGATAQYVWRVVASAGATTGNGTVDSSAAGVDANSGAGTSDGGATTPLAWTVQLSARLSILSTSVLPLVRASQGQTFNVSMNVANVGGNDATFTNPVTLSFFIGAVNRSADYSQTPKGTNPLGVTANSSVTLVFDVTASPSAQVGVVLINGTATATDDVVGVVTQATNAIARGSFTMQTPPSLEVLSLTLPPFVSIGKGFNATASVRNNGAQAATANLASLGMTFLATDTTPRTSDFIVGTLTPTTVTANQTRNVTVRVTATNALMPELIDSTATINGTDANSGAPVGATGPPTPTQFLLQTPANLAILSVSTPKPTVSQGQTASLTAVVQNSGQGAADNLAFTFSITDAVTNRIAEYTITPKAGNPTSIAGNSTATFSFNAAVSDTATGGAMLVDLATLAAQDANSDELISANGSAVTTNWTVQTKARFEAADISVSPGEIFQTESLFVTMRAHNSGEATAVVTSAGVSFTTSGADDTAEYIQTPDPTNPPSITGNTTATFRFTVSSKLTTRLGITTIDAVVRGRDFNSNQPIQDITSNVTATARIKPFDKNGPRLLFSNPRKGAMNVSTGTLLFVTFDRPMDGTTITSDAFTLAKQGVPVTTQPILDAVRVLPDRQTWQLVVPSASFTLQTTYAVLVSNRVKDIGGNPCQGDSFTFSTSINPSSLGTAPPTTWTTRPDVFGTSLRWTSPAHSRHNVPVSSLVLARWRQPIDPSTINTQSVRFWKMTTPYQELSLDSVVVTTQPTATIIVTPSVPLSLTSTYGLLLTNNVRDYDGMPAATQNALFSTSVHYEPAGNTAIRVPDEGPIFSNTNPSHDRWNVLDTSGIYVRFNEPVNPATLSVANFRVWETRPPSPPSAVTPAGVFAEPVVSVTPVSATSNTFRILTAREQASIPMNQWSTYVVAVDNRILDAAGNHAPSEDFNYHVVFNDQKFTNLTNRSVEPVPDATGPGFKDIGLQLFSGTNTICTPIRMQFTENVTPTDLTPNVNVQLWTRYLPQAQPPGAWFKKTIASITVDSSRPNSYFVTPSAGLEYTFPDFTAQHLLLANNKVADQPGNGSPGESASFIYNSTAGCCQEAIQCCCGTTLEVVSPPYGKMNVTPNSRILVKFNTAIMASTVATNVRLFEVSALDEAFGCNTVQDFPYPSVVVPCTVVPVPSLTNTFEFFPQTNGGFLRRGTPYAIIQDGGGLRKSDGTFARCGDTLNYSYFSTSNLWIPTAMGTPPIEPDESKMHAQLAMGSNPPLAKSTIVAAIPALAKYNNRLSSRLFLTLDSTIDATSVSTRSIQLQEWVLPAPIPVTLTAVLPVTTGPSRTFELISSIPLRDKTTYSMHLTNRATATDGTPAQVDEWWFSTFVDKDRMLDPRPRAVQPTPDATGPLIRSISPPRKANVHRNNRIFVEFDENVDPTTVVTTTNNFIFFTRDIDLIGPPQLFTDLTRSVTVTPYGTPPNTYQIIPSAPLASVTTYGVFFTDNLRDTQGNFSAGVESYFETRIDFFSMSKSISTFVTTHTTEHGPFITYSNPSNAFSAVMTESRVLFTLSKAVDPANVATGVFLRKLLPLPAADIPATVVPVTTPTNSFELIPSVPLVQNTTYGVFLTNIVHDANGRVSPTDEFYFETEVRQESVGSQTPATVVTNVLSGPTFQGVNPRNLRFNVQPETRIFVTFNKPVGDLSDPAAIVVQRLTAPFTRVPLSGPITPIATPANTYEVPVLSASMTREATYGVFLTNRVSDTLGNPSPGDSFQFSSTIDLDSIFVTEPTSHRADPATYGALFSSVSPLNAKLNVSPDTRILFTYNTTVTGVDGTTAFLLEVPGTPTPSAVVPGTVSNVVGDTYEFTPASMPLKLNTTYAMCLTNGVQGPDGRYSPGDEFWFATTVDEESTFSTYPTTDRTNPANGPLLLSSNPENGRMNVSTSTRILFTFNQAMDDLSLDASSVSLIKATTPSVQVPTAGVQPLSPGPPNTFELMLSTPLLEQTTYIVAVNNRAVSASGLRCPGDEFRFSTTTEQESMFQTVLATHRANVGEVGVMLLNSNPANGEMNVLPISRILMTFNTTVTDASVQTPGAVVFKQIIGTGGEFVIPATVSPLSTPAHTYEVTPSVSMTANTTYGVFITNRVETPSGVPCRSDEFQFSTSISVEALNTPTGPAVYRLVNPAHLRQNVMPNTRVLCTFADPVDLNSMRSGGVQVGVLTTDTFTPVSIADVQPVTMPMNTFDVQLSSPLSADTTYAVLITNRAQRTDGTALPQFYSNFSTTINSSLVGTYATTAEILLPETFGPQPRAFNPPHLQQNVMAATRLFVTFNTSVTSVTTESVQVLRLTTPVLPISLDAVLPVTSPPNTFELVLSSPLSINTTYGVFVTNRVKAASEWASPGHDARFTTTIYQKSVGAQPYTTVETSPDVVGPYIFLSNPNNRDFNVPLNSTLLVTFNESIVDSSITSFPNRSVQFFRLTTPIIDLGPVTVTKATTPANTYQIRTVPPASLTASTTYAILISNNIVDQVGNHAQPGSVQFSTTVQFGGFGFSSVRSLTTAAFQSFSMGAGGVTAFPTLLVSQLLMSEELRTGRDSPVMMTVQNPSKYPIRLDSVGLSFGARDPDFSVSASAGNPDLVSPGKTVALGLTVKPRAGAASGSATVEGVVDGTETTLGLQVSGRGGARTIAVVQPAQVTASLAAPASVAHGQDADVTLTLTNAGETAAEVTDAALAFRAGGADRGGDYGVTRASTLPITVPAGGRATVSLRVRVGASAAPLETVQLSASVTAAEVPGGEPVTVPPHAWTAWVVTPGASTPASTVAMPAGAAAARPGGLAFDGQRFYVVDAANDRVLVYAQAPSGANTPEFVLGGPAGGGAVSGLTFAQPGGIASDGTRLVLADTGHHRVLVWDALPTGPTSAPSRVLGQTSASGAAPNAGGLSAASLAAPAAVALAGGRIWVADTGNDRVLGFGATGPSAGSLAEIALGGPGAAARDTLKGPAALASDGVTFWVADTGHHRILGWDAVPRSNGELPAVVVGQADFAQSAADGPHPDPAGLDLAGGQLFASDRAVRLVRIYTRDPAALLSPSGLRSALIVPYPGGPALHAPAALLALPGRLYLADPAAPQLHVIGR